MLLFSTERGIGHGIMKGRSRLHYACSAMPFLFIIFGTIGLGGAQATRYVALYSPQPNQVCCF